MPRRGTPPTAGRGPVTGCEGARPAYPGQRESGRFAQPRAVQRPADAHDQHHAWAAAALLHATQSSWVHRPAGLAAQPAVPAHECGLCPASPSSCHRSQSISISVPRPVFVADRKSAGHLRRVHRTQRWTGPSRSTSARAARSSRSSTRRKSPSWASRAAASRRWMSRATRASPRPSSGTAGYSIDPPRRRPRRPPTVNRHPACVVG